MFGRRRARDEARYDAVCEALGQLADQGFDTVLLLTGIDQTLRDLRDVADAARGVIEDR